MPNRVQLFMIFAISHITLVALGMAHIGLLPITTIPGQMLRIYTGLTGADKSYGFFAPGVRHQERALFIMTDKDGQQWHDDLGFGKSHEVNLRLGSTANLLREVDDETAFEFMRSMAAKMFKRHSSAKTIKVQIQAYGIKLQAGEGQVPLVDFPTLTEYQQGQRPDWINLYHLTFQTDASGNTVAVQEKGEVPRD